MEKSKTDMLAVHVDFNEVNEKVIDLIIQNPTLSNDEINLMDYIRQSKYVRRFMQEKIKYVKISSATYQQVALSGLVFPFYDEDLKETKIDADFLYGIFNSDYTVLIAKDVVFPINLFLDTPKRMACKLYSSATLQMKFYFN